LILLQFVNRSYLNLVVKIGEKTPPADGTRGIGKLSALVQNQGQRGHFALYLTDVRRAVTVVAQKGEKF
jgi:hypothetical protein